METLRLAPFEPLNFRETTPNAAFSAKVRRRSVPNAHRFIPDWDWPSPKTRTYLHGNEEGGSTAFVTKETRERGHWEGPCQPTNNPPCAPPGR